MGGSARAPPCVPGGLWGWSGSVEEAEEMGEEEHADDGAVVGDVAGAGMAERERGALDRTGGRPARGAGYGRARRAGEWPGPAGDVGGAGNVGGEFGVQAVLPGRQGGALGGGVGTAGSRWRGVRWDGGA